MSEIINLTCIGCPMGCQLSVTMDNKEVTSVTGNTCNRGDVYARKEVTHPTRIVTSTIKVNGGEIPMVSVKTETDIPKEKIFEVMDCINQTSVSAPVNIGDVLISNVCDTKVNVIATKTVHKCTY